MTELELEFGSTFEIEPIPQDDHIHREPLEELEEMVNNTVIIIAEKDEKGF